MIFYAVTCPISPLSPHPDDAVSEAGCSVSNHRQHPDERPELPLSCHLHHSPVPSQSLCIRQCTYKSSLFLALVPVLLCSLANSYLIPYLHFCYCDVTPVTCWDTVSACYDMLWQWLKLLITLMLQKWYSHSYAIISYYAMLRKLHTVYRNYCYWGTDVMVGYCLWQATDILCYVTLMTGTVLLNNGTETKASIWLFF